MGPLKTFTYRLFRGFSFLYLFQKGRILFFGTEGCINGIVSVCDKYRLAAYEVVPFFEIVRINQIEARGSLCAYFRILTDLVGCKTKKWQVFLKSDNTVVKE